MCYWSPCDRNMLLNKAGGHCQCDVTHLSIFLLYVWVAEAFETKLVPRTANKASISAGNVVWNLSLWAGNTQPLQRWSQFVQSNAMSLRTDLQSSHISSKILPPVLIFRPVVNLLQPSCMNNQKCTVGTGHSTHLASSSAWPHLIQGGPISNLHTCTQGKLRRILPDFPPGLFKLYFPACIPLRL